MYTFKREVLMGYYSEVGLCLSPEGEKKFAKVLGKWTMGISVKHEEQP
jgi:hypothetical protein